MTTTTKKTPPPPSSTGPSSPSLPDHRPSSTNRRSNPTNNNNNPPPLPGETELLALKRIDDTATKLQRQGNYLEALECMERGLVLRQHFFGRSSSQLWSACRVVADLCNLLAVTYLQQQQRGGGGGGEMGVGEVEDGLVLTLLKKADILTEMYPPGRAVTCNNMACYYRRRGKLRKALKYLQKAMAIESRGSAAEMQKGGGGGGGETTWVFENRADTYLNACAVLSQLGRHLGALEHAQSALILLQEELFERSGGAAAAAVGDEATPAVRLDRIAVLAIAYHNIGVEQEFLKRFDDSLRSYEKGMSIAETYLGREHQMAITLKNAAVVAKRVITEKKSKARGRA